MATLLKRLANMINKVDRAAAPPGTRRQRADGRIYVKQPEGGWKPEPPQEQKPTEEPEAEAPQTPREQGAAAINQLDQRAQTLLKYSQMRVDMAEEQLKQTGNAEDAKALEVRRRALEMSKERVVLVDKLREEFGLPKEAPTPTKAAKGASIPSKIEKVLPSPSGGESQDKFIGRCMSWMDDNESDRPQDQQLAMCFDKFREGKEQGGQTVTRAELFAEVQQNAGYLVKIATQLQAQKQKQDGAKGRIEGAPEDLETDDVDKDNGVGHRMEGAPEQAAGG